MITPNRMPWHPNEWQKLLSQSFRQPDSLLAFLDLSPDLLEIDIQPDFAMLVPPPFARRMQPGSPADPLLLQVLPLALERAQISGYSADPLDESSDGRAFKLAPTLLQKYQARVLMITTPGCAVNCRYCFRRDFPYDAHKPRDYQQALDVIAAETGITEVILSGGDPLILSDQKLDNLLHHLNAIDHVRRIRLHSRLPIVLPQRINGALLNIFRSSRCPVTLVVHCNHAQELDEDTARAFQYLREASVHLLNQSVLLHKVNDDANQLCRLSEALFEQGVLPYYLHMPDRVAGTAHFDVPDLLALKLHEQMRVQLPGYLVPRLVREEPGEPSKTPMTIQS